MFEVHFIRLGLPRTKLIITTEHWTDTPEFAAICAMQRLFDLFEKDASAWNFQKVIKTTKE